MAHHRKQGNGREREGAQKEPRGWSGRLGLVLLLALGLAAWMLFGLRATAVLEQLQIQQEALADFVAARPVQAALAYLLFYTLVIAFSLPLAALLTLIGGYLFGLLAGGLLAAAAATTGATLLYLAARSIAQERLRAKAGSRLAQLQEGFRRDAFSYLLALRLVPLFPFWLVNLAPALLGVPLRPYIAATALGVLPASLLYASAGEGLGGLLEAREQLQASLLLDSRILLPLIGLAFLALTPSVNRLWKSRFHRRH
ncbi:MAG TPA: VTT domain-containing protein [Kiloniellales bacterium]|nr:VTT domain-containing protein [Kiloniellales bacterium]